MERPNRLAKVPLVLFVAVSVAAGGVSCGTGAEARRAAVVLTVDTAHPGATLPSDFLGLSFEASVLSSPDFDPATSALPAFLRDLGIGRLRFGGNSLDRVAAWTPGAADTLPSWARSRVTATDLARLGALASATGWTIDLGVNLGHPDRVAAASEVAAAVHLIGAGLGTVQIGNEPELLGDLSSARGSSDYVATVAAYRATIAAAAPSARLSGPDTAGPAGLAAYAADEGAGLALLTQHFYPLTRCGGARPTIAELLSPATRAAEERLAAAATTVGSAFHEPVRIDETNSASCGGQDGVSNTFASALWIVEYLVTLAEGGVSGVGIQGGLAACRGYTPLCVPGATGGAAGTSPGIDPVADTSLSAAVAREGGLAPQPEFYGLLLIRELEGGRWIRVSGRLPEALFAAALEMPDGAVRVLVVNHSADPGPDIVIRGVPGSRADVQFLMGSSLDAVSGESLGGAVVSGYGRWVAHPDRSLANAHSGVHLHLPASTAALVTIHFDSAR